MTDILNSQIYGNVTWLDLIIALVIFLAALVVAKLFSVQLRRSLKEKMSRENLELLVKLVNYAILVIAILWILPTIGIEPSGLMVAGGIVALAVGFASQSIIGNLISGLFLMGERPVKIGDLVDIAGELGLVEDIHIISTTIRTLDGNFMRIPNETVFTSIITNFTSNPVRRFEYTVGISYADDATQAINIIKDIIDRHPMALVNPAPQVYVDDLSDNSVDIIVRLWAPSTQWFAVKMELLWKFKRELEEAGIEIPFPQRVVWFGGDAQENDAENREGPSS